MSTKNWFDSPWEGAEQASLSDVWSTMASVGGDQDLLETIWQAALATKLGKELAPVASTLKVRLGQTDGERAFYDEWRNIPTITIRRQGFRDHASPYWQQVLLMEAGNAGNAARFKKVMDEATAGDLSRDGYIRAILEIELESRNCVIQAYAEGQFGTPGSLDCERLFDPDVMDIDAFLADPRSAPDRDRLGAVWDADFSRAYKKKHGN